MRTPAIALLLAAALPALAQTAPPIKPGLWQIEKFESSRDGVATPAPAAGAGMAERLKNMPPAQRAQIEAMMKQRGVDASAMGGGGPTGMKLCLDRESLDQNRWQGDQARCTVNFTSRTSTAWKWTSVCADPPSQGEGEALFQGSDRYTVNFSQTRSVSGQPRTDKTSMAVKRLGDDCGDVKPVRAMQPPKK